MHRTQKNFNSSATRNNTCIKRTRERQAHPNACLGVIPSGCRSCTTVCPMSASKLGRHHVFRSYDHCGEGLPEATWWRFTPALPHSRSTAYDNRGPVTGAIDDEGGLQVCDDDASVLAEDRRNTRRRIESRMGQQEFGELGKNRGRI
jgi:ferredoxin